MIRAHKKTILFIFVFLVVIVIGSIFFTKYKKSTEQPIIPPDDGMTLLERQVSQNAVKYDRETQEKIEGQVGKDAVKLTPEQKKQLEYNVTRQ